MTPPASFDGRDAARLMTTRHVAAVSRSLVVEVLARTELRGGELCGVELCGVAS